jgi:3-deoxy-D-arabino-heptulosonate 7-phosphate (DAHP) synthase
MKQASTWWKSMVTVIQIGARNMQNFSLLRRAGKARIPVLLKRGLSATLDEWLLAAEYVMAEGNYQIVLCERGIRTFCTTHPKHDGPRSIPAVRRHFTSTGHRRSISRHGQELHGYTHGSSWSCSWC